MQITLFTVSIASQSDIAQNSKLKGVFLYNIYIY